MEKIPFDHSFKIVVESAADLPILASGLSVKPKIIVTVTLPVTVSPALTRSQVITNLAAATSAEVTTPVTASQKLTVQPTPGKEEKEIFIPLLLKGGE